MGGDNKLGWLGVKTCLGKTPYFFAVHADGPARPHGKWGGAVAKVLCSTTSNQQKTGGDNKWGGGGTIYGGDNIWGGGQQCMGGGGGGDNHVWGGTISGFWILTNRDEKYILMKGGRMPWLDVLGGGRDVLA